jgi:16S rRNA (cytosine967-C5)-methyltransferase
LYSGAPVERAGIAPGEIGAEPEWITGEGELRTLPCHFGAYDGIDGFYCARLVKRGS